MLFSWINLIYLYWFGIIWNIAFLESDSKIVVFLSSRISHSSSVEFVFEPWTIHWLGNDWAAVSLCVSNEYSKNFGIFCLNSYRIKGFSIDSEKYLYTDLHDQFIRLSTKLGGNGSPLFKNDSEAVTSTKEFIVVW